MPTHTRRSCRCEPGRRRRATSCCRDPTRGCRRRLERLQDTTASIFFAPDVFGISIIQGRLQDMNGVPVVGICETPFTGTNELVKRISDVVLSSMILVGPRPHAVAHNEEYRQLIKAYMVRHKVRPRPTGWAQINGHRGETDTVDKMKMRVAFIERHAY